MRHYDFTYFGGENPITDGGIWIMKDDYDGFYILVELSSDLEGNYIVSQAYINIDDGWIDWNKIKTFGLNYSNDFEKVISAYKYYGASSFDQGEDYLYSDLDNALGELRKWDIFID